MFLKRLSLQNYRNYTDSGIEFNTCGNLLFGKNGQGKTNLLESIYYLSVFRSFRKGTSRDIAAWGEDWFRISGFFETDSSIERTIAVHWERGSAKQVMYENERMSRLAEMIGVFPCVLLSPESIDISQGFPSERRKFMDLCFSMIDSEYLDHLMSYRRVLRHRNSLLYMGADGGDSFDAAIEPWDEELVQHGSYLIGYRARVIGIFSRICRDMYAEISGGSEELEVGYEPCTGDAENPEGGLRKALLESSAEERRKKTTLTGPHRDDLQLLLNGRDARKFGSQGQHKTILLALKAAELRYIHEVKGVQPVILLDDLFALLDSRRLMNFFGILHGFGQFFITANVEINPETHLSRAGFSGQDFSQYEVEGGTISRRSE